MGKLKEKFIKALKDDSVIFICSLLCFLIILIVLQIAVGKYIKKELEETIINTKCNNNYIAEYNKNYEIEYFNYSKAVRGGYNDF